MCDDGHPLPGCQSEKRVVEGQAVLVELLQQSPVKLYVLEGDGSRHLLVAGRVVTDLRCG